MQTSFFWLCNILSERRLQNEGKRNSWSNCPGSLAGDDRFLAGNDQEKNIMKLLKKEMEQKCFISIFVPKQEVMDICTKL